MKKLEDVYEIDYQEFDTIVKECMGISNYNFLVDMEASNDTDYVFRSVLGEDDFWLEETDDYMNGISTYVHAYGLLEMLVLYEILPPGTFIINVCW